MRKFLLSAAVILLAAGLGLGSVGAYIYYSANRECAVMIARAEKINQTAIAAKGTAEAQQLKEDAEYARKGAVWGCENSRERKTNALLFSAGALIIIVTGGSLLVFSRRTSGQFE